MATRIDNRAADEMRPVLIRPNWLTFAEGSALVEFGETRVLCAATLTEGVPFWQRASSSGWVNAEYAMLPRADRVRTERDSVRGQVDGRAHEISRLISRALRSVVDLAALGEWTIQLDCDVLQADGGTRTAAITGGYVALAGALAGLRDQGVLSNVEDVLIGSVAAVSVGIVDGARAMDLCYQEDVRASADLNVVYTGDGGLIEVQGAADHAPLSRAELDGLLNLAADGCTQLAEMQQQALGVVART